MPDGSGSGTRIPQIEDLLAVGVVGVLTDGELVDRFLRHRGGQAETAFTALVERHGPMVLRVCNIALRSTSGEDAFQATFLVLARHAGLHPRPPSVASWLSESRAEPPRRSVRPRREAALQERARHETRWRWTPPARAQLPDSFPELHAEIGRLPRSSATDRALYFEGLTHEQAARRLSGRWEPSRPARASRDQLRSRLKRRGRPADRSTSARAAAGNFAGPSNPWSGRRSRRRRGWPGRSPAGLVSSAVLTTTRGVSRAMLIHKSSCGGRRAVRDAWGWPDALALAQQVGGKKHEDPPSRSPDGDHDPPCRPDRISQETVTQIHSPLSCHIRAVRVGMERP